MCVPFQNIQGNPTNSWYSLTDQRGSFGNRSVPWDLYSTIRATFLRLIASVISSESLRFRSGLLLII